MDVAAPLSKAELQVFRKLTTPAKIQQFLDELGYNLEPKGATCYSPRIVLRERVAHCMEGALVGAAALRFLGFPALLLDLEGVRDSDHALAVIRLTGGGERSRSPITPACVRANPCTVPFANWPCRTSS